MKYYSTDSKYNTWIIENTNLYNYAKNIIKILLLIKNIINII